MYVVGRVGVETPAGLVGERDLPGAQGRLLLALLVVNRQRALTRDEIAEHLWPAGRPRAWEAALSALLSKLRTLLDVLEPAGAATVGTAFGAHQLHLPNDVWVDLEAAVARLDEAEAATRAGDLDRAWVAAHTTWSITKRPFLVGVDAGWVEEVRTRLDFLRLRSLGCLADVWTARREFAAAETCIEEIIAIDPCREDGYRRLMEVHLGNGNPAAALGDYERCRRYLAEQLGARPGAETRAAYERALAAT